MTTGTLGLDPFIGFESARIDMKKIKADMTASMAVTHYINVTEIQIATSPVCQPRVGLLTNFHLPGEPVK
jgi:hypothetical protein